MDRTIFTTLITAFAFIFLSCNKNINNNDVEIKPVAIEEKHFDVHKKISELKEVSIFFESSYILHQIKLRGNDLIGMVKTGESIDTLKFTDKNDKLFIQLQKVLETIVIDSTLFIGRSDTIWKYNQVKNIPGIGLVIRHADNTRVDTIAINTSRYKKLLNGKFRDATPGKTIMFLHDPEENDIVADYMILYQYNNNDSITNDTLYCDKFFAPTVRFNSYVATADSVLFEMIGDTIREKITSIKTEILRESYWKHFISNRTFFRRYVKNNQILLYKDSCKNSEILLRCNNFDEGKIYSNEGNWLYIMLKDNDGKEIYGWIYPIDR